jgi:hypothetical protein
MELKLYELLKLHSVKLISFLSPIQGLLLNPALCGQQMGKEKEVGQWLLPHYHLLNLQADF